MNRRQLLVGSTTAITAALAGCTAMATNSDGTDNSNNRTISVSHSGEVAAEPDLARIRTSIEVTGDEPTTVRDELNERADTLREGLVASGLDDDQITTDRFQVRDRVDRRRAEAAGIDSESDLEQFTYYEGTHRFRITVEDTAAVGRVVDAAIDSGADSVDRIEFTLSDERRAERRNDALESALDGARAEAEFIATEVDATVVEVQSVDTSDGRVSPVRAEVDEVADDTAGTTIDTDDVTVRATASVRYRIG